jgi:hypothetical protein
MIQTAKVIEILQNKTLTKLYDLVTGAVQIVAPVKRPSQEVPLEQAGRFNPFPAFLIAGTYH